MRILLAAVATVAIMSCPAEAKKQPQVTGLALQQIQARDYEATKAVTFPSVMTVLQDSGYRIQAADKDTGLITATASTKSKLTWAPFVGFGRSKKTPVVSAYIEDRGAGSRIRLSFVMAKVKANAYGTSLSDEEPITDPATYRDAFERIEKEIFVRQALSAPAQSPAPAAASSAPQQMTPGSQAPAVQPANGLTPNPSDMPPALKMDPKPQ
ncbi:MAG TPA: hypothetical protein VNJ05_08860 [Sphingomicrobium sp.]|nr:hypothetical protein [Sphingomicrobium sp.]